MRMELLNQYVTEFRQKDYPDVPLAEGVDLEALSTASGDDPFFVTLPLLKVGAKSRNKSTGTWKQAAVERVASEINTKKPEGFPGHIRPEDRPYQYEFGKLRWVGAVVDEGTLYGKAYVPRYANEAREYFQIAEASGSRVGTSIYGRKGKKGLEDLVLESIDLGHTERLGYPGAAVVPQITKETEDIKEEQMAKPEESGNDFQLIAEILSLGEDRAEGARKLVIELEQLRTQGKVLSELVEEMQLGEKPLERAKEIIAELHVLRQQSTLNELDNLIAELVKNESLRPYLRKLLVRGNDLQFQTLEEARTLVTEYLEDEEIQNLAKVLVRETRGPNGFANPIDQTKRVEFNPSPEEQREAALRLGLNIN